MPCLKYHILIFKEVRGKQVWNICLYKVHTLLIEICDLNQSFNNIDAVYNLEVGQVILEESLRKFLVVYSDHVVSLWKAHERSFRTSGDDRRATIISQQRYSILIKHYNFYRRHTLTPWRNTLLYNKSRYYQNTPDN